MSPSRVRTVRQLSKVFSSRRKRAKQAGHNRRQLGLEALEDRRLLATLLVTNVQDSGPGSLRQAIIDSNQSIAIADEIRFSIPGPGPHTIQPDTPYPTITDSVVVDGYTQPDSQPNSNLLAGGSNAVLQVVIDGVNVVSPPFGALDITAGGSTVRGLVIHRFPDGAAIRLAGGGGNVIEGNYLGTDAGGLNALGNGTGVLIEDSSNNVVGGTTPDARNIISGNDRGVSILSSTISDPPSISTDNFVSGNYIGVDATGQGPLGNAGNGVFVLLSFGNVIGGLAPEAGNVIAFNSGVNTGNGVLVDSGAANAILGNAVLGNSIFSNGLLGINLALGGPTPNDPNDAGDADEGTNRSQNFPEISAAQAIGDTLTITYRVNTATGNALYPLQVEFFLADSDAEEGRTLLGRDLYDAVEAQTDKTITVTPLAIAGPGQRVVATATDDNGNTSEFSFPAAVIPIDSDFGDAPDSYGTTSAINGAQHFVTPGFFLGASVDLEANGRPTTAVNGDDLDAGDDEDGLTPLATLYRVASTDTTSSIVVTASQSGFLDAWIDFNANGVFDHPAEHLGGGASQLLFAGPNVVSFTVPAAAVPGQAVTRLRLSSGGNLGPTGYASSGEVEDHVLTIADEAAAPPITVDLPTVVDAVEVFLENGETVVHQNGGGDLFRAPKASISSLHIRGSNVNDQLLVDFNGGDPIPSGGLAFDGGRQISAGDELLIKGGAPFLDVQYHATGPGAGFLDLDGSSVTFQGLEPVTVDATLGTLTIAIDDPASHVATFSANDGPGVTRVDFDAGLESLIFSNPTAALQVVGSSSFGDTVIVAGFGDGFQAALTVDGQGGSDRIDLDTGLDLGSAVSTGAVDLTAEFINLSADIRTVAGTAGVVSLDGAVTLRNNVTITATSSVEFLGQVDSLASQQRALFVDAGLLTLAGGVGQLAGGELGQFSSITDQAFSLAVPLTATDDVLIEVRETAAAGEDVTIGPTGGLRTTGGDITIDAGDDVTVTGAVQADAGQVDIVVDAGNADRGLGSTVTLTGPVSSTAGTNVIGGADPDTFVVSPVTSPVHLDGSDPTSAPGDQLVLPGGGTITFTGPGAGNVDFGDGPSLTFENLEFSEIRGVQWEDQDSDGVRDAGELGMDGWVVFLDANGNGELDAGETSTETDAAGAYRFVNLLPGTYTVAVEPQDGWEPTAPRRRFEVSQDVAVGMVPAAAVLADVDHDNDPDVIVPNDLTGDVSVLLNLQGGPPQEVTRVVIGSRPRAVAAADVNGDTHVDLLVVRVGDRAAGDPQGGVSVLLGNGDGTFQPPTQFAAGDGPIDVVAADLDDDGDLDLATANFRSHDVSILLNDGNGGFAEAARIPVGAQPLALAAADFDDDGDPDLAVAAFGANRIDLLRNDGAAQFTQYASLPTAAGPAHLNAADVDGDQDDDLVVAEYLGDSVSVLISDGSGGFAMGTTVAVAPRPQWVAVGDVTGDGWADIVAANAGSDSISLVVADGQGGFWAAGEFAAGRGPACVLLTDWNNDQRTDAVVADGFSGRVSVLNQLPGTHTVAIVGAGELHDNLDFGSHAVYPAAPVPAAEGEFGFQNSVNRFDVDDSGDVSPLDVLLVINALNVSGGGRLPVGQRPSIAEGEGQDGLEPLASPVAELAAARPRYAGYVDVSGDQVLSALDALLVINHLNGSDAVAAEGEGEAVSPATTPLAVRSGVGGECAEAAPLRPHRPAAFALRATVKERVRGFGASVPTDSRAGWDTLSSLQNASRPAARQSDDLEQILAEIAADVWQGWQGD